jgi:hypothetical protein
MNSAVQRATHFRDRLRKYLLYGVLSILIAVGGIKITFVVVDQWGDDAFIRWVGLTVFSLGLFGFFLGNSEKFLRKGRFWVVTAILLTGHLTAFVIILTHIEEWKLMWFMVMVIEYPLFTFFRDRFVNPR